MHTFYTEMVGSAQWYLFTTQYFLHEVIYYVYDKGNKEMSMLWKW
jgi:ATP-dependent RNA circularization protein (DNA/RNA ligase family)